MCSDTVVSLGWNRVEETKQCGELNDKLHEAQLVICQFDTKSLHLYRSIKCLSAELNDKKSIS